MTLELVSVLAVLAIGLLPLVRRMQDHRAKWVALGIGVCAAIGIFAFHSERPQVTALEHKDRPNQQLSDGYVSSASCRSCHPSEYASWSKTYHRTMTQLASPESIKGDFNSVKLTLPGGRVYALERRGDTFWVSWEDVPKTKIKRSEMIVEILRSSLTQKSQSPQVLAQMENDLAAEVKTLTKLKSSPVVFERQIVQVTGSHHYQVYWMPATLDQRENRVEKINKGAYKLNWIPTDLQGELLPFPFVYLLGDKRWVRRGAVFVQPSPEPDPDDLGPWNDNCIKCHATHGKPRRDEAAARLTSKVVEFGIACESCHGPGGEHVRLNQKPQRRYALHLSDDSDETMAQPARMDKVPSSQVCGQCHSVAYFNEYEDYLQHGSTFRPGGDDLHSVKDVIWPKKKETKRDIKLIESFWPDGVVRLLGREYNGLIDSACHTGGDMSCMSCHQLHGSDPNDQLKEGMDGNKACLGCHQEYQDPARVSAHTHHAPESSGSNCMNCHMPYTVFGLLKSSRSHYIDTPSAQTSKKYGRPNGCNQCHLDKTLGWTAEHLTAWYGAPEVKLSLDEYQISATLLWLLKGDGAQRALAAWTLGWDEARKASESGVGTPILARVLNDPYAATRYVIGQSLTRQPGFEDFEYDFVGSDEHLKASVESALELWKKSSNERTGRALLLNDDGTLMEAEVERLLKQRDDRPIILAE